MIILLNGASSSGKTTLALELQRQLPEPFLHFRVDHLREGGILPMDRIQAGDFSWSVMRPAVFEAYHRMLRAMVESSCNVIADHIIETEAWRAQLAELLGGFDLLVVAVRCPLDELERRERARGNRRIGEAAQDAASCYNLCLHDLWIDSRLPVQENTATIIEHWLRREMSGLSRLQRP